MERLCSTSLAIADRRAPGPVAYCVATHRIWAVSLSLMYHLNVSPYLINGAGEPFGTALDLKMMSPATLVLVLLVVLTTAQLPDCSYRFGTFKGNELEDCHKALRKMRMSYHSEKLTALPPYRRSHWFQSFGICTIGFYIRQEVEDRLVRQPKPPVKKLKSSEVLSAATDLVTTCVGEAQSQHKEAEAFYPGGTLNLGTDFQVGFFRSPLPEESLPEESLWSRIRGCGILKLCYRPPT